MSLLCFLFACALTVPHDFGYVDAQDGSRIEVDAAIAMANEHLGAANIRRQLVYRGASERTKLADNEIAVYVVVEPGSAVAIKREIERLRTKVLEFQSRDFQFDPAFQDCSDTDDCVENLYKGPNVASLVIETIEKITNSHVAEANNDCRCVILFARDLQRYQAVLGAPWARFLLRARFSGEIDPDTSKVPDIMLHDDGFALRWILVNVLLHEVGHHEKWFMYEVLQGPAQNALQNYRKFLGTERKIEEARADAFGADVMSKSCFSNISSDAKRSCITAVYSSMVIFGITLWGKTKEARCVRYFDPSIDYPNFHLRGLVRDLLMVKGSRPELLEDFLDTRAGLSQKPWIKDVPICLKLKQATFFKSA
ncbi:hypothetical protein [Bradyrhizobium vignae]|uniref:Uncharacterized protein n=1 Tax=Bradyrhizobium vignae TaxID=1549949 RepID=A0ABS4A5A5_9BRAD|nr:hypothetical protein [Bradyrhizobium vignae]MBP0115586.1 hypothetical protein [Bradyrhizobium vignae]